jgi:hypothetical protein
MSASSAPFFDGLERGELRYQVCAGCHAVQPMARRACRRCRGTRLEWRRSSGHGVVYAANVVDDPPSEDLRPLAPYTLVVVDLDEGARLVGHAPAGTAIGDRVTAEYFAFAGRTLVRFRPQRQAAG